MTGRAAGFCAGYGVPGYANSMPGRGFVAGFGGGFGFGGRGAGRGGGRGWRNQFHATGMPGWMRFGAFNAPFRAPDADSEKQALRQQADALQAELEAIRKRLDEIEKAAPAE